MKGDFSAHESARIGEPRVQGMKAQPDDEWLADLGEPPRAGDEGGGLVVDPDGHR